MSDITDTMSPEQKRDYENSLKDFDNILKPFLMNHIENIVDVVINKDVELDRDHGIDFRLYIMINNKIEGFYVACKMQKVKSPYKTICMRYSRGSGHKTEFAKMKELISTNNIRPQIHMHAYCSFDNKMFNVYLVNTDSLVEYATKNIDNIRINYKYNDSFMSIDVDDLLSSGIKVIELKEQK